MDYLSYKDICKLQSSVGMSFAESSYDIVSSNAFKQYFTGLLDRKHLTITEDCPHCGLSRYTTEDIEETFSINASYFFNLKTPSIFNNKDLLEFAFGIESDMTTIITPFEGYGEYFVTFDALFVQLGNSYEEYLKTLNSKHRNKVLSLDRKSNGVTYEISNTPNEAGFLYNLKNANKHNDEDADFSMFYKSQILYATALSLSGYDKCWFQTIYDSNKEVVGYSSVVYDETLGELLHYSNCSANNLGSYSINNFIKYFCGKGYKLFNLVSLPEYPWDEDFSVNGYKKPLSNLKLKRKTITSLEEHSSSSYPPFYAIDEHKWYL